MAEPAGEGAAAPLRLARLGPAGAPTSGPVLDAAAIVSHDAVAAEYLRLVLDAPAIAATVEPGQFVMLTVARDGEVMPVLPRPMAVYGWDRARNRVEIVYRVVGDGTRRLTEWRPGERMTVVGPLGRGFVLPPGARRIALLGRGIGTCSLTALAGFAARRHVIVDALVSARHPGALVGSEAYRAAGARTVREVVDSDGSSDRATVAAWLAACGEAGVDHIYTCGSERLLRLATDVAGSCGAHVQVSLEAHMACGLGYCHGCATGHAGLPRESPLVCRDGPVFRAFAGGDTART